MNLTYMRIDLSRQLRDVFNIAFVLVLPVLLYVLFGSTAGDGTVALGRGNIKFYVMASMAAYGAALAATGIAGSAAIEMMQGWGRQLGLTPLRSSGFVAMKVVVAILVSGAAVLAVGVVGFLTGANAPAWVWAVAGVIAWLVSAMFALYGLAIAQWSRSESAIGIASASLVLLAFFGNLFVPLSGTMLAIARWTPMYGLAGLVRYPQMQGQQVNDAGHDALWALVLSVLLWTAVFAAISVAAVRRGRRRQ